MSRPTRQPMGARYRGDTIPADLPAHARDAIATFKRAPGVRRWKTRRGVYGKCWSVVRMFAAHLDERGVAYKITRYLDRDGDTQHAVVVGGYVVDFAARIYRSEWGFPRIVEPAVYAIDFTEDSEQCCPRCALSLRDGEHDCAGPAGDLTEKLRAETEEWLLENPEAMARLQALLATRSTQTLARELSPALGFNVAGGVRRAKNRDR